MFRNTLLTVTATIGMIAGNELTASTAQAQSQFSLGVGGKNGSFNLNLGGYGQSYGAGYGSGIYGSGIYGATTFYPPVVVASHHVHFTVYFRECGHDLWRVYGTFHSHHRAHDAMNYLRSRGFETYEVRR